MPQNSLHPGFILIDYQSQYGRHKQTLPTTSPAYTGIGDEPDYINHAGATVAFNVAVAGIEAALAGVYDANVTLNAATAYDVPTPTSDPLPIYTAILGTPGTSTVTGWSQAVQRTYNFRTTGFGQSRLVLLDCVTNNQFGRYTSVQPFDQALIDVWTDVNNIWLGRDGFRPAVFTALTITINDKLRRAYDII